ncbi:MAG: hypothetical protein ACHQQQ_04860 [Bacteroidota bacterium]
MKTLYKLFLALSIIFMIGIAGCSKNDSSTNPAPVTDEQALQSQIVHSDSLANFINSEGVSLDDGATPQNPEYGIGKVNTLVPIVRYGRYINWNNATRAFQFDKQGDSVVIVTVITTLPGNLILAVGSDTSVVPDSLIRKPYTEINTRKIRFVRIASTSDPAQNWLPVSMTLMAGSTSPSPSASFHIVSVEFTASSDTIITDPLNTWFKFGRPFHSGIPYVLVGDTVTVRVTIQSAYDSAEVVHLRHGIDGTEILGGRVLMYRESSSFSGGIYTRTYRRKFVARNFAVSHPQIKIARFSAIVDVFSYDSIHDDVAPFQNEVWGTPYITIK